MSGTSPRNNARSGPGRLLQVGQGSEPLALRLRRDPEHRVPHVDPVEVDRVGRRAPAVRRVVGRQLDLVAQVREARLLPLVQRMVAALERLDDIVVPPVGARQCRLERRTLRVEVAQPRHGSLERVPRRRIGSRPRIRIDLPQTFVQKVPAYGEAQRNQKGFAPSVHMLTSASIDPNRNTRGGRISSAPYSGWASQNSRVPSTPITKKAVESASASVALAAMAVALTTWRAGRPVRGSRMWPYRRPPAVKNWWSAADVPSARSRSQTLAKLLSRPQRIRQVHRPSAAAARR